jgi:hypothetical protein
MKKDEALHFCETARRITREVAGKLEFPRFIDDGKLYFDEWDKGSRWAQRFSLAGHWPHVAPISGVVAAPGLRYEIWYFSSKHEEELRLLLLCGEAELASLQMHLAPTFKAFIEGGRYAARYQTIEPLVSQLYRGVTGIQRRISTKSAKAETAIAQLLQDTLKPLDAAFTSWPGAEHAYEHFKASRANFDPVAALQQHFKKR